MCVACLPEPVAISPADDVEAEVDRVNAESPNPRPRCAECRGLYHPDEGAFVFPGLCCSCEINRFERLIWAVVWAKSRKKRRKALRRIARLRHLIEK